MGRNCEVALAYFIVCSWTPCRAKRMENPIIIGDNKPAIHADTVILWAMTIAKETDGRSEILRVSTLRTVDDQI
jgi:hypothetical protein